MTLAVWVVSILFAIPIGFYTTGYIAEVVTDDPLAPGFIIIIIFPAAAVILSILFHRLLVNIIGLNGTNSKKAQSLATSILKLVFIFAAVAVLSVLVIILSRTVLR